MRDILTFQYQQLKCDLFCRVIDNYGDAAVCWRLAKELVKKHHCSVRLIIDQPSILAKLDIASRKKNKIKNINDPSRKISIIPWKKKSNIHFEGANLIIEAFACNLEEDYLTELANFSKTNHTLWINLEYLSAESWIETYHLKTSPHPQLPIKKIFFFPGFTPQSGGLLPANVTHQNKPLTTKQKHKWWRSFGIKVHCNTIFVSIFCYEQAPVDQLIRSSQLQTKYRFIFFFTKTSTNTQLIKTFPKNKISLKFSLPLNHEQQRSSKTMNIYQISSHCSYVILPFLNQNHYDDLLWHCDFNFVRGEDSFVRAQWAAQPFCWHIYPQQSQIHHHKLNAFIDRFLISCEPNTSKILKTFWYIWNFDPKISIKEFSKTWIKLITNLHIVETHVKSWRKYLSSQPDLVSKLINLYQHLDPTV